MSEQDLSIIIVSFNTSAITHLCLTNLKRAVNFCEAKLKNKIEVIVVDNASTDNSVEIIKQNHRWVNLLESKTNLGFSGGNNLGLQESVNPYILLLNSDAYVKDDTLLKAFEFFIENPNCDVLGCALTYENGRFQPSSGYLPKAFNLTLWMLGIDSVPILGNLFNPVHPKSPSFFSKVKKVGWVMGAFLMMKRNVYQTVGGFDQNIFMYAEEVELCIRIKKANFNVYFTPTFLITHLAGASSNFDVQKPIYMELKNLIYVYQKHYPNLLWYFKLNLIVGCLIRIVLLTIFNKPQRKQAYLDALKLI